MTIDGTNISTYGLRIISMGDYYNQPARKKILQEPVFDANSIKFESKECTVTLYGEYDTLALMRTGVEALKTKITTNYLKHDFNLIGHNLQFTGVVANGIKSEVIQKTVQLTFTITITE